MQSIALVLTAKTRKQYMYTTYAINTKERQKNVLSNRINYLIWYAFYDLRSGNGASPILTASEPARGALRARP